MQGRSQRRLDFHTWSGAWVILVFALVLVESQYYMPQLDGQVSASSRSNYYFYDDQAFLPGEEVVFVPQEEVDSVPHTRTRRAATVEDVSNKIWN